MVRDIAKLSDLSYYPQLCDRIQALTEQGCSAPAIATQLNSEGYRPARQDARFGLPQVTDIQRRLGVRPCRPRVRDRQGIGPEEWWASDLAERLQLSRSTLHRWIQRGWVRARQEDHLHRWIVWADEAELMRLGQLHQRSLPEEARRRWTETRDNAEPTTAAMMPGTLRREEQLR